MAIQNDNTILKKADLKAYHERIAPMLGGTFMVSTSNSDYYSTDEKVVGVWEDGKPIYQKTVHTGPFTLEASSTVAGRGWQRLTAVPANLENLVLARFVNINGTEYKTQQSFAFTMGAIEPGYISVVNFRDVNLAADDALLFLQYTKTTDAAGSALTTPGAYDINFPNTWPANKEIYFGNGIYGQRRTGTITDAANARDVVQLFVIPANLTNPFVSQGGSWVRDNDNVAISFGASDSNGYSSNINYNGANGHVALISTSPHPRTNAPYNIWVTYTK